MTASDFWCENAPVYGIDVETFVGPDGDGVGDFQGPIGRLGHPREKFTRPEEERTA